MSFKSNIENLESVLATSKTAATAFVKMLDSVSGKVAGDNIIDSTVTDLQSAIAAVLDAADFDIPTVDVDETTYTFRYPEIVIDGTTYTAEQIIADVEADPSLGLAARLVESESHMLYED